ncbi:cell division protein FtsL [Halospina denitrificans]|uniref:Cell division protein FtsL n=1 Tax=Halospina denitrificans TaxID=332522 RepID=A0A4R7JKB7_9GAMM|nr:cell division protein FtsL [Halospina denitrificans]TDT37886.1 cell division protein FtsL [Halospina denitrificans]
MGAVRIEGETGNRALRWRMVLDSAARVSRRIFRNLWRSDVLLTLAMVGLLLGSALAVAYSSHLNRSLYSDLASLQEERDGYQRQWTQLLLEQSALSAHSHVESRAARELDMQVPSREDIVVLQTQ